MCRKMMSLSIFIGLFLTSQGQELPWATHCNDTTVYAGGFHSGPGQNLRGTVVLRNGDSLSGCMQLIFNRCALEQPGHREYKIIHIRDIRKVQVDIYSLYRKPVELYTINQKHMRGVFWRLIESKGKFTVFDRSEGLFSEPSSIVEVNNSSKNGFNEFMYLVSTDNHIEKIYGRFSIFSGLFLVENKAKQKLLKYINRKYKKQFKETDFKTEMEMVDYILTQENAS